MIKYQEATTKPSNILLSQQYCSPFIIEAEWEDLCWTNSPCDIFTHFAHYFRLNNDDTSLLYNEGEVKVIGDKDKSQYEKNCINSRFSITVLQVGGS